MCNFHDLEEALKPSPALQYLIENKKEVSKEEAQLHFSKGEAVWFENEHKEVAHSTNWGFMNNEFPTTNRYFI